MAVFTEADFIQAVIIVAVADSTAVAADSTAVAVVSTAAAADSTAAAVAVSTAVPAVVTAVAAFLVMVTTMKMTAMYFKTCLLCLRWRLSLPWLSLVSFFH